MAEPIRDIAPERLIEEAAKRLKALEGMGPPAWSSFAKTGVSRERPPQQNDWWWIRSASVLRKFYTGEDMGVSRLRRVYSGRKRRGHKPEHRYSASGAVIRKIVQQLEGAGFLRPVKGRGRLITLKGRAFLREAAEAARAGQAGGKGASA